MDNSITLVRQLVEDFKAQESAYLSLQYQESQVRLDFIDKFFTALGWDVSHTREKNPYEQEVKIENRVRTETSQRFADYAFYVTPNFRDVKFFAEAKKPARSLSNPNFYYQTIRYGWNQKTPIAVLTDFEELHIIDCRSKPEIKSALDNKIESFHYSQYSDEETFNRIYYLFGREAVARGSIDKYSASLSKPKQKGSGKGQVKSALQQVDGAFLELLDAYRDQLAHAFKNKNQELSGEELTEVVQRTIDRLVFVRFLEDKFIEEPLIRGLVGRPSVWHSFQSLCQSLEPKYNGLVFKQHRLLDSATFVAPDDQVFGKICAELSDPASPYDFDKIPISILGNIYERFLGKVIVTTDKRATVQDRPEVRKAGGVYYTPEYIVRYIVEETVGELIQGKTPTEIAKMAFADIACGSGSFLLEVYNTLLVYHTRWYNEHPEKVKKGDVETRDGGFILSLKKRREILINNIYGVDIDQQAYEVTQVSLYLKLLEDATMSEGFQFSLLKEKLLPDLKKNIVCGNSLIEPDILLDRDEEPIVKPFNFVDAFPEIIKRGGFDAIVGNPPYVRQEQLSTLKSYFQSHYKVYHPVADLYTYFIERGIQLLKYGGCFSYIVSNKWLRANYGEPLRVWLKEKRIEELIDFGDLPVFSDATTYPCILRVKNGPGQLESLSVTKVSSLEDLDLHQLVQNKKIKLDYRRLDKSGWSLSPESSHLLYERLRSVGITLHQYTQGKVYRGIITGLNQAFVISEEVRNNLISQHQSSAGLIKPFLAGKEVKRYSKLTESQHLIFIPNGWTNSSSPGRKDKWKWFEEFYPAIANHLIAFESDARKRYDQGEYWWELRACDYYAAFESPKIIFPNICKKPEFTLDLMGYYTNQKCFIISTSDKYLLGILNSKMSFYLFRTLLPKLRGGYYEPSYVYFKEFPIRIINAANPEEIKLHNRVVELVETLMDVREKLVVAKTDAEANRLEMYSAGIDRQLDETVYALYALTEEDIKIVEDNNV